MFQKIDGKWVSASSPKPNTIVLDNQDLTFSHTPDSSEYKTTPNTEPQAYTRDPNWVTEPMAHTYEVFLQDGSIIERTVTGVFEKTNEIVNKTPNIKYFVIPPKRSVALKTG